MAKRFTRNVKDVKDVKTFGINHTTQNDLINDDKNVFVHQKGKFEKITHQIDTLSSNGSVTIGEKDDKDNVSLSVYTGYVDKITSTDESLIIGEKTNGTVNVEVDYAPIDEKIQVANSQLEEQVMEAIGIEETNRTEADTQLATNLATEVADRKSADNAIQTQIDSLKPIDTSVRQYNLSGVCTLSSVNYIFSTLVILPFDIMTGASPLTSLSTFLERIHNHGINAVVAPGYYETNAEAIADRVRLGTVKTLVFDQVNNSNSVYASDKDLNNKKMKLLETDFRLSL